MAHTPGPWHVARSAPTQVVRYIAGGDSIPIATASTDDDARLIAEAPALLAACRLMYEDCVVAGMTIEQDARVRDAIARAVVKVPTRRPAVLTFARIAALLESLRSEDGENPEYDRAIAEGLALLREEVQ